MSIESFFWHDYETFGANPRRDRPAQFAGQRTSLDLEPIGEPLMAYCRPARDFLPEPDACLITGITPQIADQRGLPEPEFAAFVETCLGEPGTCGVGYNSIRFDDEVTRFMLYRNFHDPYQREWKNGNSRWDLIDVVRLCHALRPEGIEWPQREDGATSFRLEDLSQANGLSHESAHDALSDVNATIALARLLKDSQPRLFDWALSLRRKNTVRGLLDYARRTPVLHVSSRYPADRGCLAMVAPICAHPHNANGVVVFDLDQDPAELECLSAEAIAERVFTRSEDLPPGTMRIGLKTVHLNRSPMLAPLAVLKGVDHARLGLDPERCLNHARQVQAMEGLAEKLRKVFAPPLDELAPDADEALYTGFPSDADRALIARVRSAEPDTLSALQAQFGDSRYAELLFRYRARNHPNTLGPEEQRQWTELRRNRLLAEEDGESLWQQRQHRISELRKEAGSSQQALLDDVEAWSSSLVEELR